MPSLTTPALAPGALAGLPQPVLTVPGGLTLRPWAGADASAVVAAYADPGIQQWHARSMTTEEAYAWIASWRAAWARETGASWAVADGAHVVGQVGLRGVHLPEARADLSYWVLPAARGRRVAVRAVHALGGWAFGALRLHRLELQHSTGNAASCRVAQLAGYPWEGTKRRVALHGDGWHDMHLHARLHDDPPPAD